MLRVMFVGVTLMAGRALLAQPIPPDYPAYGFGVTVCDTHGATVVAANAGWFWLWYAHSGMDEAMPAPGCVQIMRMGRAGYFRGVEFRLEPGKRVITVEGYPDLRVAMADVLAIAQAKEVRVRLIYPADERGPRHPEYALDATQREYIGRLAQHGRNRPPTTAPWLLDGVVAYVIDSRPAMKPWMPRVTAQLTERLRGKQRRIDQFSLILNTADGLTIRPAARGVSRFRLDVEGDRKEAAEAIAGLSALAAGEPPLSEAVTKATNQRAHSIVYFTTEGGGPIAVKDLVQQLHAAGARLFVVWYGEPAENSERWRDLVEVARQTNGGVTRIER